MSNTKTPKPVLLGEVVTWAIKTKQIAFSDLISALQNNQLDQAAARQLAARNAFSRACRTLSDQRIIRKIDETNDILVFQFTKEIDLGKGVGYDYQKETTLSLDKNTGYVLCPDNGLQAHAQQLVDFHVANRTGADVTRIVQKLFEQRADLFAIRDQGGAYFVPIEHQEFTVRVEGFIQSLGGKMKRFPVPRGYKTGENAAKDAIARGLEDLILEHEKAIEEFGKETRQDTLKRHGERIQQTRFKVEAYAAYIEERKEELELRVEEAKQKLKDKIDQLAAVEDDGVAQTAA